MKNTIIHIRIEKDSIQALRSLAKKEYRTISALVNRAINNFLKQKKVTLE